MKTEVQRFEALRKTWIVVCNDLWLLTTVYLAHFIVWRELRRLHREGELK